MAGKSEELEGPSTTGIDSRATNSSRRKGNVYLSENISVEEKGARNKEGS
jgi:hypothetical protein